MLRAIYIDGVSGPCQAPYRVDARCIRTVQKDFQWSGLLIAGMDGPDASCTRSTKTCLAASPDLFYNVTAIELDSK